MLVLTLDDESVRAARINQRGALEVPDTFESKDAEFQLRVNEAYVALAKEYDLPTISAKNNAGRLRTIDEIQLEIRQLLNIA